MVKNLEDFNKYIDLFNAKITLKEFRDSKRYDATIMKLYEEFLKKYSKFAKEELNIQDLKLYLESLDLFKNCYNVWKDCSEKKISVATFCRKVNEIGYGVNNFNKMTLMYLKDIIKMSDRGIEIVKDQLFKEKFTIRILFNEIENTIDENEIYRNIYEYLDASTLEYRKAQVKTTELLVYVKRHIEIKYKDLSEEEQLLKQNALVEKVKKARDRFEIQAKKQKILDIEEEYNKKLYSILEYAKQIINDVMNTNLFIKDYFVKNKILTEKIKLVEDAIKVYDQELYEKYTKYVETKNNETDIDYILNTIYESIRLGIEDDGVKRPFNILDYYNLTQIEPKNLSQMVDLKKYTSFEVKTIRGFLASIGKPSNEREIGELNITINGIKITEEMKEEAIKRLKERNIPVHAKSYLAILNCEILKENNKELKKEINN